MTALGPYAERHSVNAPAIALERSQVEGRRRTIEGSEQLRLSCQAYFLKWEREHGFVPGAGELLVLAGWSEGH